MQEKFNPLRTADQQNPNAQASRAWLNALEGKVGKARMRRLLIKRGSITIVAALMLFGSTASFAQSTMPNHPLYPMKRLSEHVIVVLAPSQQKSFIARHLIDRRIEEAKQHPELASFIEEDFVRLIRLQEKVIAHEPLPRAIPDTIDQTVMFQRDLERLRVMKETQTMALALAQLNQRLLAIVTPISNLETYRSRPLGVSPELLLIMPVSIPTPTPEDLRTHLSVYHALEQSIQDQNTQTTHAALLLLQTKNELQLQLISTSF